MGFRLLSISMTLNDLRRRLSHQGGGISVVSGGGGRIRGEDINFSAILMYIVSIISSM